MKQLLQAMVHYFERVPDQVRRRRWLVWLAFIAATVFCVMGMGRAKFDATIEGWFERDDPLIVAFDWFHHEFGSDDHLYVVYKPKDGDVFSAQSLETLRKMQAELRAQMTAVKAGEATPWSHVVNITSLINAPVLRAENDVLISKKLVGDHVPESAEERERLRQIALTQNAFPLLYFSKDYRYGGILVETNFGAIPEDGGKSAGTAKELSADTLDLSAPTAVATQERPRFKPTDMADYVALMDAVKAVIAKPEYAAHFEYHAVGSTATAEYNLAMISEMGLLNLAALVIMMALLWVLFRSASAVVWSFTIVVLSVIWSVGIVAWLGFPVTSFVMISTMLTLAVGVADTVHVMSAYVSSRNDGTEHRAALRHAFGHVALACLLTTITNIVAVAALSITPVVPIQVFALMCALGVGLPFVFCVYLLPLLLDLWAPKPAGSREGLLGGLTQRVLPNLSVLLRRMLDCVLPVVEKSPATFVAAFAALFAVCIYGATLTRVDTDPVGTFPAESPIRRSVAVVDENMMGAQSAEIYFDLRRENAFHDPAVLGTIDALQRDIEHKYADVVVRTTSIVDTVKQSYRTLNAGQADKYIIPATTEAVSQTLFLFNQSNPEDRRKLVSDNYDRSHVSIRLYNRGSYEYTKTWDAIRADVDTAFATIKRSYPDAQVAITGMLPLMMQGADVLTRSELTSFGLALILISAVLLVLFGSVKAGAIAIVPNLIPAILSYGVLGLLGRPLDITTMMIAPIIIGIAVDDTVHFVTRYRHEVAAHGDIRRALETTIRDAGQSVIFTSLILGLGFGAMAFASDSGVANLGIFGALAMLVGVLNDLFLLPALILMFKLSFRSERVAPPAATVAHASAD
jgi:predicted RND superfamily exporter protein